MSFVDFSNLFMRISTIELFKNNSFCGWPLNKNNKRINKVIPSDINAKSCIRYFFSVSVERELSLISFEISSNLSL
jgi:hypothetical protein